MAIEIETSTDTVEEVKSALAKGAVEIDDTAEEETEKPPAKDAKAAAKAAAKEDQAEPETEEESEGEVGSEEEGEEKAEADKGKEKPKTVPLAVLEKERKRRQAAEAKLAAKDADEPGEEEAEESTATSTVQPERPKTFSGKPEPQLDDFLKDVDVYDPAALAKAQAAHAKACREWDRAEGKAEAAYDRHLEEVHEATVTRNADFAAQAVKTVARRPDYHAVIKANKDVEVSLVMNDYMIDDSDVGPDLLLHLIENRADLKRIRSLSTPRAQRKAMRELEATVVAAIEAEGSTEEGEEAAEEEKPPKKQIPPKKTVSSAPPPTNRLKPAGPGVKSLRDLAGPADKVGVDLDFNPDYEKAAKGNRRS